MKYRILLQCVGTMMVTTPKGEDTVVYRFTPAGEYKTSVGNAWPETHLSVFDAPGCYEIGKEYEFTLVV